MFLCRPVQEFDDLDLPIVHGMLDDLPVVIGMEIPELTLVVTDDLDYETEALLFLEERTRPAIPSLLDLVCFTFIDLPE